MHKYFILATLTAISFTGCSNSMNTVNTPTFKPQSYQKPSATKSANFKNTMMKVALSTRDDAKYNKIELDTPEKKAWFKDLMFRLWDRQITRHQFMAEGMSKYPTHRYEFAFVANGFQKHS
ncbi:MAG TPA: hypothetical protein ENK39_02915 [Epsilonproteobacteria bacterium]|nr:hypothetical protein [Campylobacterota bacterium]